MSFSVVDATEILTRWHAGRSISQVARSLGVDRTTVRTDTAPALAAGAWPGGEPISWARWAELVRRWFPELTSTVLQHPRIAEIAPYHQLVEKMLADLAGGHARSTAPAGVVPDSVNAALVDS